MLPVTASATARQRLCVRGSGVAQVREACEGEERETQRDREAGRQTDRETDRQTDRQRDRQTDRQTDRSSISTVDFLISRNMAFHFSASGRLS